jgi:hypothetical protein
MGELIVPMEWRRVSIVDMVWFLEHMCEYLPILFEFEGGGGW